MGYERDKRLGLVGLDPEQREKDRAAVAESPAPRESDTNFPSRAIKNAAGIYAFAVFAVVVCAYFWAFPKLARWLGRDWAALLLGVPTMFSPMLLAPLCDRAESRLREWYCKRHGGHILKSLAGSELVFMCIRCEHTVVKNLSSE